MQKRRDFLKLATAGAAFSAASLLVGCDKNSNNNTKADSIESSANNTNSNAVIESSKKPSIKLKMAMSWPINMPILSDTVKYYIENVRKISQGSIDIELYPAGKLVPALGVFDAAAAGQIDCYHSAPYYWEGKNTAFNLFSGIPFGMIDGEMNAWYLLGDGMSLWREIAAKYGLVPLLGGATSIQMSGWYKKEIKSVQDFNGLRIRMVGVAGQVLSKLGAACKNTPGADLVPNLERGVLDAAEWVAPAFDLKLDIHKVAPFYYTPWQEAGSITEFVFNAKTWDKLGAEAQNILELASRDAHLYMTALGQYKNAEALAALKAQGAQIKTFEPEIIAAFKKALNEVLAEESAKNADFAKVLASYQKAQNAQKEWSNDSLGAYLAIRD